MQCVGDQWIIGTVQHVNPWPRGSFRISFRNFTSTHGHSFAGQYGEFVPCDRIFDADKFEDPTMPGEIRVTATPKKISLGTEQPIVQESLADAIPGKTSYPS